MLAQQIGKRLVCKFLEILHAIPRKQVEGVPGFLVELNALAGHGYSSLPGGSFASKCGQLRFTMARTSGSIAVISSNDSISWRIRSRSWGLSGRPCRNS